HFANCTAWSAPAHGRRRIRGRYRCAFSSYLIPPTFDTVDSISWPDCSHPRFSKLLSRYVVGLGPSHLTGFWTPSFCLYFRISVDFIASFLMLTKMPALASSSLPRTLTSSPTHL